MNFEEIQEELKEEFGDRVKVEKASPKRIYLRADPEDLLSVAEFLFDEKGGRLATVSSVDSLDHFELLYHFCFDGEGFVVTLKISVEEEELSVQSLGKSIPATMWIEREIHDLMGIDFPGHPGLKRLLKSKSTPGSAHPLKKDFDPEEMEG